MNRLKLITTLILLNLLLNKISAQNSHNTDVRNISFFYAENDSLKSNDGIQWSACAQLIFMRNDSVFDQIFLVDQIPESPYSTSNKIDLKIVQFVLNFDNSFNKGVFAVNYNKILGKYDSFCVKPISLNNIDSQLKRNNESTIIKIYYYKKDLNSVDENVIIQQDHIVLKLILKDEPFAREYTLASPSNNKEQKIKVLIL